MQKLGFSPKIRKIYTRQSVPTLENSRKMLLYELFTKIHAKRLFYRLFAKSLSSFLSVSLSHAGSMTRMCGIYS